MEPAYEHLLPRNWDSVVQAWLDEDIPGFDIGGYVVGSKEETAVLYGKTDGIMAGRPFFERVFTLLGCKVRCYSLACVFFQQRLSVCTYYSSNSSVY